MSTLPQFLYRIHPSRSDMLVSGPTPHEATVVEAHFAYLQHLTAEGVVLMAGRTLVEVDAFGLVLLQAASEAEARALMEADPAVSGGVMHATLFPFRVALWSTAFQI